MLESLFLLETPSQVLSSEICENFKNNCFCRTLPVAASVKWNIEKSTSLNGEGPKRGTKRSNMKNTEIFHFRKTEKHCSKYVQSETKNKFCKTKCLKLNFYKCVHFLLFLLLSTFWIYYFYCFPIHFYCYIWVFILILYIMTLISRIFRISTKIPDQDFKKIVTLVQKQTLPFVTTP